MEDQATIQYSDLKVDIVSYSQLFREYGHIFFELKDEENEELMKATNQFKEIEKQEPGFDKRSWVEDNIKPLPSEKPFAVFSFLVTQWNPTTIISNTESPNTGYIYVSVTKEGSAH